ncbi:MAG: sensor histidine kinase [Nonomuraea sp.]|nr:sensor histidine kinase [Nonomuraea sp.]
MPRRLARSLAFLLLTPVELAVLALSLIAFLFTFGLGLVPLFQPQVRMVRRVTGLTRDLVLRWCGITVDAPYRPKPPPPRPGPDGLYRHDRTLYRSPRIPAWNARWRWMMSDPATWRDLAFLAADPLVKVALTPMLLLWPARGLRVYGMWTLVLLGHTTRSRLASQVSHLNSVRDLAVDSQAAEMRRIERDLHDGTQARLVAIGMTLGAVEELVEQDPAAAKALLSKARDASAETLTELRRVVRGIHPPVLAERGLADAVRALAMDSALRVEVTIDLPHRPAAPVEAAAYFAISELLSNAARHGDADNATIDISSNGRALRVTVTDDGMGGADPAKGSGLVGIERRLAAFDGVLAVSSPPGGPTTVTMDLPRVLPEHWAGVLPKMPKWKLSLVVFLWATAWCPTFPQGLVVAVMKVIGFEHKSWFLALYLPAPLQWPMIIFMIMLGVTMYALAIALPNTHRSMTCVS